MTALFDNSGVTFGRSARDKSQHNIFFLKLEHMNKKYKVIYITEKHKLFVILIGQINDKE